MSMSSILAKERRKRAGRKVRGRGRTRRKGREIVAVKRRIKRKSWK